MKTLFSKSMILAVALSTSVLSYSEEKSFIEEHKTAIVVSATAATAALIAGAVYYKWDIAKPYALTIPLVGAWIKSFDDKKNASENALRAEGATAEQQKFANLSWMQRLSYTLPKVEAAPGKDEDKKPEDVKKDDKAETAKVEAAPGKKDDKDQSAAK